MIRLLLCLAMLVPVTAALADFQVINPVYRKPETVPPPQLQQHVPPAIDVSYSCKKPTYPASVDGHPEGVVDLQIQIEPDGQVSDTRILKSSGTPALDEATSTALTQCHYKPGTTADGVAETAWVHIRYTWALSQ